MEPVTLAEVLAGFASDVETFFTVVEDEDGLDDDDRAELIKKFEGIEELVKEAQKIIGVSSEND